MTKRVIMLLSCATVLLMCALSTQGSLFWLLFWVLMMMLLLSVVSSIWTKLTLKVTCELNQSQVERGDEVILSIHVRHACPLPVAALRMDLFSLADGRSFMLYAPAKPFVTNNLTYGLYCPHVGAFPSGVSGVRVSDVFGMFSFYHKVRGGQAELLVTPQVYLTEPLTFSPGESDNESAMAKAFEDATMPTDLRAFQQGDELKKVHWKLSLRRNELLVRVYEQPQRPDALLLVDCAPPDATDQDPYNVRDAICEAAASVASIALQNGAPVRMPLLTEVPVDINATKTEDIALVRDALARCAFDGTQQFERVLMLETRRMRRTGTTAVITSRLNATLAEMILSMRRMGPKVRVLVAMDETDETVAMLITRLMRNDVEVETIEVETA